jgi:hypothetical protein
MPRALSWNASISILCVFAFILPSVKQNLMQICYFFTSVTLTSLYDRKKVLTQR